MSVIMSGRGWAYTGASLGGAASIAANVAHSFIPPANAALDWTPEPGAVVGAIVWPVFLFVAVEILARVAWPTGLTWQAIRWAGMLPVAAVAALVSYRHLSGLLAYYGEEPIVCVLGPLAVDGLMVMATGAILATGQPTSTVVSAEATDTIRPAPTPPAVSTPHPATPETADGIFLAEAVPTSAPALPEPARPEFPTPADVAARITPAPASTPDRPAATRLATASTRRPRPRTPETMTTANPLAAPATDTPVSAPEPAQLTLPTVVDPSLLARAEQVARQYRTEHGTPISAGQLAARLRVNSDVASQALAVMNLGPHSPTQKIATVNGSAVKAAR
jgi:hypothetical protein